MKNRQNTPLCKHASIVTYCLLLMIIPLLIAFTGCTKSGGSGSAGGINNNTGGDTNQPADPNASTPQDPNAVSPQDPNAIAPPAPAISSGPPSNIIVASGPNPNRIYIKGTSQNQTSTLTFEVRDKNGNPVTNDHDVRLQFIMLNNGLGGGESLDPRAGSDPNDGAMISGGQASTTLESGFIAGTVRIIAFIDANTTNNGKPDPGEVQSEVVPIAISGGPPDGENLCVHPEVLNIAGLRTLNLTDNITAKMSDRYHNPVPPGTAVEFTTDFASITGPGVVPDSGGASEATAVLTSMGPLPGDGFVTPSVSTQTGNWGRILCLARHPSDPDILYAGTDGGGILMTTNAQSATVLWSWVGRPETGLTNGVVRQIRIDKTLPSIVYAATDGGVFKSTGSGDHWRNMSISKEITGENLGVLNTTDTTPSDGLSDTEYTLTYESTLNRSKTKVYLDGVETKSYIYTGSRSIRFILGNTYLIAGATVTIDYQTGYTLPTIYPVYAVSIDPADNDILFTALYGRGIYKSDNGGYTWHLKNSGLSNTDVLALAIDPTTLNPLNATLYAGTWGDGVYRSIDAGENWSPINNGLTAAVINTILVDPSDSDNLYTGTMLGGIFRSTDKGMTWSRDPNNVNKTDSANTYVKDIILDTADGTLYAGTYTDGNSPVGGVFKCESGQETWQRVSTGLENPSVFCLEIIGKAGNDTLFAGAYRRIISRTADSGAHWTRINENSPDDLSRIFAATRVLFSDDTRIITTPISATYQGYGTFGTIYNTESHTFYFEVSDYNGNPITGGSQITATVTQGTLSGNVSETMPDTQYGSTVYSVTWTNDDVNLEKNVPASLNITVTSEQNGNLSYSVLRTLIATLSIKPDSEELDAGGGSVTFIAKGGSDMPANYVWTTSDGTLNTNSGQQVTLATTAAQDGAKILVTVTDTANHQVAEAEVKQKSP